MTKRFDPGLILAAALTACSVAADAQQATPPPAAPAQTAPPAPAPLPPDSVRGKQLYHDHGCYGCHGFNGETGARDLVATNSPLIADEATFIAFLRLRADQAPLLPSTRMPNYPAAALSDTDARDIYAYVRTFELNAPPVESAAALRAILEAAQSTTSEE